MELFLNEMNYFVFLFSNSHIHLITKGLFTYTYMPWSLLYKVCVWGPTRTVHLQ